MRWTTPRRSSSKAATRIRLIGELVLFTYDSLSRLTSACNPESATTNFYYTTSSGGLCSGDPSAACRRTGAHGITTTFAYDALNRLMGKTYSDSTPAVGYSYGQSRYNGLTITNGIGRRAGISDAAGAEAWSYDPMGRVLAGRRATVTSHSA
jgi:hypothetical protein